MTTPLFNLTGKVALITGGSKGLGKAMARGFAEAGADIVICSRHGSLGYAGRESGSTAWTVERIAWTCGCRDDRVLHQCKYPML